jgi:hypothetical protein
MPDSRLDSQAPDALHDAYVQWVDAALQVRLAYHRWRSADRADAAEEHARYTAALDREAAAAHAYARPIVQARRSVTADLPAGGPAGSACNRA